MNMNGMRWFPLYGVMLTCTAFLGRTAEGAGIVNGGFEEWGSGNSPASWTWGVSGGAAASLARDEEVRHGGRYSVRLSSQSEYGAHVYGGLSQRIGGLKPRTRYCIRVWTKGASVGVCWLGGGVGWETRAIFPEGTFDWQVVECAFETGADETAWDFRLNVDSITEALWIDDVTIEEVKGIPGVVVDPSITPAEISRRLDVVEKELPVVAGLLKTAGEKRLPLDYPKLKLAVVERFIGYGREDLKHNRMDRAIPLAGHIERLLGEARTELRESLNGRQALPAVPRYRTGKIDVVRWHFEADTEVPSTGQRERRPVFFNGYGHFNRVVDDLPVFESFGANIIQIEQGPSSTVKPDFGVDLGPFDGYVGRALKEGADHNVVVAVLASPHYFPGWAYERWPQLGGVNGGFIRFAIDPAESRRVIETHLRAVADRVKSSPALHSICLSNEPVYIDSRKDAMTRQMWTDYLRRRHGTIEGLNRRYGSAYASFEAVAIPAPDVPRAPARNDAAAQAAYRSKLALVYDWVRFNNQRFSDWHRWMGQVVQETAPGLWVHAKVMTTVWDRHAIFYGTDPEQFSRISSLNGNDSYSMYDHNLNSSYAGKCFNQAMFYDLQASMRTAPVVNTEDHLIVDRDLLPIPPEHTYSVLWQAAIHRLGASTVWVWERTYDLKSDFEGSILHRPGNVEAAGRAHLDLMRLSREVVAIQESPRPVGLLFSLTSIIHAPEYLGTIQKVYEALSMSGWCPRFVSEDQVAAGQWDGVKLLIVPRAVNVPVSVREGVRRFGAAGGKVVLIGRDCLSMDEYGQPLAESGAVTATRPSVCPIQAACLEPMARAETTASFRDRLLPQVEAACLRLPATLTDASGKAVFGVEWQSVQEGGRILVNVMNWTRKPVECQVRINGKPAEAVFDLIARQKTASRIKAGSLVPMMLEVR